MINLNEISLLYKEKYYIKKFSSTFEKNKKYVIHGDSGSGKSSIFSIIMGFTSFEGNVIFENKINDFWNIRKNCGYFTQNYNLKFQNPNSLIDKLEMINKDFDQNNLINILNMLKIDKSFLSKNFNEMSGGEKQRIFLATVLSQNKEILLLDEPTSALDHNLEKIFLDYIKSLNKTIITISHSQKLISNLIPINSSGFLNE